MWAIIGPPAKRHLNGVSLAGRWWPNTECWLVSFVVLRGSGPILLRKLKKPYIFVIFQGGGGPDPLSPLWIRTWQCRTTQSRKSINFASSIHTLWIMMKIQINIYSSSRVFHRTFIYMYCIVLICLCEQQRVSQFAWTFFSRIYMYI